jgi:hypothetical protein
MLDEPTNPVTVYLTREQVQRLAGIACDALVGIQITTDASDQTFATIDMVPIDDANSSEHYTVYSDGSYGRTT